MMRKRRVVPSDSAGFILTRMKLLSAQEGDSPIVIYLSTADLKLYGKRFHFLQVHLDGSPRVGSVAITISPGSYQHFAIFVVELMEGNKAMYKPCSKFEGRFQVSH